MIILMNGAHDMNQPSVSEVVNRMIVEPSVAQRSEAVMLLERQRVELRLYCWMLLQSTHHVPRCILRSLLNDGARANLSCTCRILHLCILLATAGSDAAIIPFIMMVPIDSPRQELSNGCHIIFCSNFDLIAEIPGCSLDLQAVGDFLAPFLTESFGKF